MSGTRAARRQWFVVLLLHSLFVCSLFCLVASHHTLHQLRLQQYTTPAVHVSSKLPSPSLALPDPVMRVGFVVHIMQNLLVCIEMLFGAVAHHFYYGFQVRWETYPPMSV